MADRLHQGEIVLRGIPVSAGVARGRIIILEKKSHAIERRELAESEVTAEINRLEQALVTTRQQLQDLHRKLADRIGTQKAGILDAQLLMLEDPALVEGATSLIQNSRVNAEFAVHTAAERYAAALAALEDELFRERAGDVRDVVARVVTHLSGQDPTTDLHHLQEPCLIIAHDLTPSDTAQLDRHKVLGFATEIGSKTSHTAILSHSLRIPAVVGLKNATAELKSGQYALLDGFNGVIIVNPTDQTLFEYGQLVRKQVTLEEKLRDVVGQPALTLDNHRVLLSANIEQAADVTQVKASGAEGVGLFRTEYLFIARDAPPTEEEQFAAYREVALALKPHPVVIRTLDLGGDKFLSHLHVPTEMNPFLGWRAIRFCLAQRDIFGAQLRAILRASAEGNVKMMYPMISGLEELNQANALLAEFKEELRAEGKPFDEQLEVGAMIEIPSAVLVAPALARRAQFFSIGTNDLIQYTLAVDRMNEKIAHLYEPTHPAILRLIKETVDAAHAHDISVSVCGEMAGDPTLVPLLLGLGVDELSASPALIAPIKYLIRRLKRQDTRDLAEFALSCESATQILARCQELAERAAPGLFEHQP